MSIDEVNFLVIHTLLYVDMKQQNEQCKVTIYQIGHENMLKILTKINTLLMIIFLEMMAF